MVGVALWPEFPTGFALSASQAGACRLVMMDAVWFCAWVGWPLDWWALGPPVMEAMCFLLRTRRPFLSQINGTCGRAQRRSILQVWCLNCHSVCSQLISKHIPESPALRCFKTRKELSKKEPCMKGAFIMGAVATPFAR